MCICIEYYNSIYSDKYMISPVEVWGLYIHSVQRLDEWMDEWMDGWMDGWMNA